MPKSFQKNTVHKNCTRIKLLKMVDNKDMVDVVDNMEDMDAVDMVDKQVSRMQELELHQLPLLIRMGMRILLQ